MSAPQPPTTPTKSTTTPPLYHPIYNPPYKISYGSELTGKIIRRSKRRITFQFGFSDPSAIAAGKKGLGCRGSEHEVIMTWSHISGTVEIIHDGRVVTNTHWSNSYAGNTRFNHSWMVGGEHQMEIVANASGTPKRGEKKKLTTSWGDVGGPSKEYRQFDLLLDGMSFFDFCEMSHLGKKEKH